MTASAYKAHYQNSYLEAAIQGQPLPNQGDTYYAGYVDDYPRGGAVSSAPFIVKCVLPSH